LEAAKPPVLHGSGGVSQKAEGVGRGSHYYSLTRLLTTGEIRLPSGTHEVEGTSWFDHEWATNQLAENQTGWDWFSLQFDDGSELMIFQIRTREGGRDVYSGGTWIAADGSSIPIANADFQLNPAATWTSRQTGATYPVGWSLQIPKLGVDLKVGAAMENQELFLPPVIYWEGAIRASGTRNGNSLRGTGYLEMTGYGSPIVGMQAPPASTKK